MPRVLEVRLKDKTTHEYVDVEPDLEFSGPKIQVEHRHERHDDGSLSVFEETYRGRFLRSSHSFLDAEKEENLVGHYVAGQVLSIREFYQHD